MERMSVKELINSFTDKELEEIMKESYAECGIEYKGLVHNLSEEEENQITDFLDEIFSELRWLGYR